VELLSAYPALVIGTVVGYLADRLGWRFMPIIATGAAILVALALYQSTVPFHQSEPWSGTITPLLWVAIAAVNAGSWALGLGIGTTLRSRLSNSAS
jgi:MFS-type transporter involved in bile tolerance (Atg22 family)